jgi:hypothetical protein
MGSSGRQAGSESGAALLLALATTALITALAVALIVSVSIETTIVGSARAAQEVFYAADAALERTLHELGLAPDWSGALASPPTLRASFDDGVSVVRGPDGRLLSMAGVTVERQAVSALSYGPGVFRADAPVWRLFGHAPLAAVLPPGLIAQPGYLLVWVGDDGLDGDGDPSHDANGQILVYVDAYGVAGARRGLEAAIARAGTAGVRLLAWKDSR